jgi:hypothetical protein
MILTLATAGPSAYWYLARGSGVAALLLLTASVVLGLLNSLRFASAPRWPRFAIDTLHRDISLVVIALLAVHIITSVLDTFAPIRLIDAVIPFASTYRPLWLGLGALSFDLLVALVVTSLLRRRLGYRAWRAVHWLAYASWPIAVLHGLGTGTDTTASWTLVLTLICVGAVLVAVWVRVVRLRPDVNHFRVPALALSVATPVAIAVFTVAGPLQRGWARRAGTPSRLLAHTAGPAAKAGRVAVAAGAPTLKLPFTASVAGTVRQTPEPDGAIVDLALRLQGGARGRLRVRLAGAPLEGGGLSMTGSQVDLLAAGVPSVMEGQIVALQGQQFLARVSGSSGTVDLRANLNIDSQTGAVTGTLSGTQTGG